MSAINQYYQLTKPGIIRGNAIHVLAGVFFASYATNFMWSQAIGVIVGTSLVIASACVVNNYIDRHIDAKMKRTKSRATVTGSIGLKPAAIFAAWLLAIGLSVLAVFTNSIVVLIGLVAYVTYVGIYTPAKPRTIHSTLIGAVPGALPIMAGYAAIAGELNASAWLLFALIFLWQIPHFYAISIFRRDEYKAANIPVLGVVKPFAVVKQRILVYMLAYVAIIACMIWLEATTPTAGLMLLAGGAYWLFTYFTAKGNEVAWARSVFGASLVLTLVLTASAIMTMFTRTF